MTGLQHFLWLLWCFHLFPSFGTSSDLYRCPKISVGVMKAFRGKCYRFVPNDKTWDGAQYDCQRSGGNLVHIKDPITQMFVYNTVKKDLGWRVNGMWIGAHDRLRSNDYEWVNGDRKTKGTPVTWSFWADGQPSCGFWSCIEFCGQMRLDEGGRWHDYQCGPTFSSYHYCCMYDMGPKTTTTTAITTTTPSTTRMNTTPRMKSTASLTTKTKTTVMETTTKATTTTEASTTMKTTATMEANTPPRRTGRETTITTTTSVLVSENSRSSAQATNTSVSVRTLVGGLIAGVALLLLLLLLVFMFRRRRRANKEQPTPNIHFTNNSYGGEIQPVDRPSFAVHINPTFGPSNGSAEAERPPEVTHRKEVEQNELNRACAKANGEWRESTNPYDTIPFDKDFEEAKTVTFPATEYLHAKSLRKQDNGPPHTLKDSGSLDSLHRPRSTEENEYCDMHFPKGESAWSDVGSDIHQPTLGFCDKQLDGYLSPSQIVRPLSGASATESVM